MVTDKVQLYKVVPILVYQHIKIETITVGTIHYVITNGRNLMGSYAGQLTPADRWRVSMYIMSAFKALGSSCSAASTTETNTK
jgi:predicted membrane channel-forming protein YqfA (hemolysin III family)